MISTMEAPPKKRAIRTCEWGQTHLCNRLPKMAFQNLSLLLLIWSGLWGKKKKRKAEKGRCDGDALLPTSFDRHMLFLPLVSLHLLVHIEYSNACCSHMLWMHMDVHGFRMCFLFLLCCCFISVYE
ncbi:unnamed protein product [Musa acuminata var. zebrina]